MNNWNKSKRKLANKRFRALFSLISKMNDTTLPLDKQCYLFDTNGPSVLNLNIEFGIFYMYLY